jgi:cell division protein FtsB
MILVGGYFLYSFISTEWQLYQLKDQRDQLNQQIVLEQDKSDRLNQELEQLHSDDYMETLARRYFGLVYPHEKIIIEVDSENNEVSN